MAGMLKRSRRTRFNPEKFREEAELLAESNPAHAAEMATHWRRKFNEALEEGRKGMEQALEIGVAGLGAFGLGVFDGRWEYERQQIVAKYKAANPGSKNPEVEAFTKQDNVTDPTAFFGIPKTLWATVIVGGAAVFGLGGKNFNYLLRSAGVGFMATWASGMGRDIGHRWAHDAETKDATQTNRAWAA